MDYDTDTDQSTDEGEDYSGDGSDSDGDDDTYNDAGDDSAGYDGDEYEDDAYDDGTDSGGDDSDAGTRYADDQSYGACIAQEHAGDEGAAYHDIIATQDSTDETGYAADAGDGGDGPMAMQADALPGTDGAEPQRARVLTFRAICSTGHDEWVGSKRTSPNQAYTDAGWHDGDHHHSKPTARVQQFDPQDRNGWTDHKFAE